MHTYQEALENVLDRVHPPAPVPLPLEQALHRVLGETILCPEDHPPFTRSAYDGYLVPDGGDARVYRITGEVQPGRPPPESLEPGAALRIYTGSALPEKNGTVFMVEDTEEKEDFVHLKEDARPVPPRVRGGDAAKGSVLFSPGHILGPADLAALAAIGHTRPLCLPSPGIHHALTGQEVVPPETEDPAPGCIRDSNSIMLRAMLRTRDCSISLHRHVPDEPGEGWMMLHDYGFFDGDLLLLSGGCSVGGRDATLDWLTRAGFTPHIQRTRIRPGKPMIFATRGHQLAFGLPGNPVSHFTCMLLYGLPALDRLLGAPLRPTIQARLTAEVRNAGDHRESFLPASLSTGDRGDAVADPLPWTNSGNPIGLIGCNSLIRVPLNIDTIPAGETVEVFAL